ncbi:pentatricopeptide repeat-containing protein At4g21705, mitochondrial-like [Nicotiana sylvestris]|uniref:Pentatricopeptide repeat-containing protein At4g21705, mitochondrial-like n=1 Tax=Nicotiana sylvestris TaxID=4096 RepID=A0A1U7XRI5_NICSY|nr:PREDICTED: pentatricopeptide repeat-containing protein At4g21705, mitochondrial-like [Nicotiana sylvestris]
MLGSLNQCSVAPQAPKPINSMNYATFNRSISYNLLRRAFPIRAYCTVHSSKGNNLFSRISPVRRADLIIPVLDQWVVEGRKVTSLELQRIVRDLRSRKRFSQALQVSEWMSVSGLCPFKSGDCAVHLDLIGVVHGWEAAECYFNNLTDEQKNDKTYGALFNCYIREGLVEKSLAHFQKMKELGYAYCTLVYNNLMCLYRSTGQLERVSDVLSAMKENGVTPNNFSYRICINCCGERADFSGMEKLLEEMESQPFISVDWITYSMMANVYIKAEFKEKALAFLKKLEDKLHKDPIGYNHLISHYANLGNKEEMLRLWGVQKIVCKKQINRDYITMLGSLVKLGDLETAEAMLKEWESSNHTYDFRVPNVLLIGYCQNGLVDKAEIMLQDIIKKGKTPIPNSWAIIAAGYLNTHKMEKAFECLKEAIAVRAQNPGWRPKPHLVSTISKWLGDQHDTREQEAFLSSLKTVVTVNKDVHDTLGNTEASGIGEKNEIEEIVKL